MTVGVVPNASSFRTSSPRPLFAVPQFNISNARGQYAVVENGGRFLFNALVEESSPRGITVLLNWPASLSR
jgi:hypothetical protein